MIYSKKNDFLFIKGRKVAGTSVEIALSTICGPEDIISPIVPPIDEVTRLRLGGRGAQNYSAAPEREKEYIERLASLPANELSGVGLSRPKRRASIYYSHMSLMAFMRAYGCLPTERIFCVVRSPYAKFISGANMHINRDQYRRNGGQMQSDLEALKSIVDRLLKVQGFHRNIDLYRGEDGKVRIRTLRFESLAQDFAQLMTDYGISPVPDLPHVKQGVDANSIDPQQFFTRNQLDRINEICAEEFDAFGYQRL